MEKSKKKFFIKYPGTVVKAVTDEYYRGILPAGYEYTGEYRKPLAGEIVLWDAMEAKRLVNKLGGKYFILYKTASYPLPTDIPGDFEETGEYREPEVGEYYYSSGRAKLCKSLNQKFTPPRIIVEKQEYREIN